MYDMTRAQTKFSRPDFAMSLPSHVDIGADDSSDGQSWSGVDSDDSYYSDPPTSMTRCTIHLRTTSPILWSCLRDQATTSWITSWSS